MSLREAINKLPEQERLRVLRILGEELVKAYTKNKQEQDLSAQKKQQEEATLADLRKEIDQLYS